MVSWGVDVCMNLRDERGADLQGKLTSCSGLSRRMSMGRTIS